MNKVNKELSDGSFSDITSLLKECAPDIPEPSRKISPEVLTAKLGELDDLSNVKYVRFRKITKVSLVAAACLAAVFGLTVFLKSGAYSFNAKEADGCAPEASSSAYSYQVVEQTEGQPENIPISEDSSVSFSLASSSSLSESSDNGADSSCDSAPEVSAEAISPVPSSDTCIASSSSVSKSRYIYHSLSAEFILLDDGTVLSSGTNHAGALGLGLLPDEICEEPAEVSLPERIASLIVSPDSDLIIAVSESGTRYVWGDNSAMEYPGLPGCINAPAAVR